MTPHTSFGIVVKLTNTGNTANTAKFPTPYLGGGEQRMVVQDSVAPPGSGDEGDLEHGRR